MKDIMYKKASVIGAVLSIVLLIVIYALLGTVELVYVNGDREVYRQENVRVISKIDDPVENMSEEFLAEGETMSFTYLSGNEKKTLDVEKPGDLKVEILKTLVLNLFSFKWEEQSYVIEFTAK